MMRLQTELLGSASLAPQPMYPRMREPTCPRHPFNPPTNRAASVLSTHRAVPVLLLQIYGEGFGTHLNALARDSALVGQLVESQLLHPFRQSVTTTPMAVWFNAKQHAHLPLFFWREVRPMGGWPSFSPRPSLSATRYEIARARPIPHNFLSAVGLYPAQSIAPSRLRSGADGLSPPVLAGLA